MRPAPIEPDARFDDSKLVVSDEHAEAEKWCEKLVDFGEQLELPNIVALGCFGISTARRVAVRHHVLRDSARGAWRY